jgi:hypothetical protein
MEVPELALNASIRSVSPGCEEEVAVCVSAVE